MMDFIAFDLETTGTVAGVDRIVEIGAVCFKNGAPASYFSSLVDPEISIPIEASRVNKITDDMVKGQPKIYDLLEPLSDFCRSLPLVAHNAPFDTAFLVTDFKSYHTPAPSGLILDTLLLARKMLPGLPNYRLGTLVSHFNLPSGEFHRAHEDATYCGHIFIELLKKLKYPETPINIENLISLTGKPATYFPVIERQPRQLDLFGFE